MPYGTVICSQSGWFVCSVERWEPSHGSRTSGTRFPLTETKWAKKNLSSSGESIVEESIATCCALRTRIVASSAPPMGMASDTEDPGFAGAPLVEKLVPEG